MAHSQSAFTDAADLEEMKGIERVKEMGVSLVYAIFPGGKSTVPIYWPG